MKRLRIVLFGKFLFEKSLSFIITEGRWGWSATCGKAFFIIRIIEFGMLVIILSNSLRSHCRLYFVQKSSKDKMFPNLSNEWLTDQIFFSIHSLKNKDLFLKRMNHSSRWEYHGERSSACIAVSKITELVSEKRII